MAHEESPIRVNRSAPVRNTGKGNRYAGQYCAKQGGEFVEIKGNRKACVREQVLKVKTDNDTDGKTTMLISIACGASRRRWRSA
jgi:hypothetical protein